MHLRQVLLIFSLAVLFASYLVLHQVEGINPWDLPKPVSNCSNRCQPEKGEGLSVPECVRKHGLERAHFQKSQGACDCSLCFKIIKEGEDCTLMLKDKNGTREGDKMLRCDAELRCCVRSGKCEKNEKCRPSG